MFIQDENNLLQIHTKSYVTSDDLLFIADILPDNDTFITVGMFCKYSFHLTVAFMTVEELSSLNVFFNDACCQEEHSAS